MDELAFSMFDDSANNQIVIYLAWIEKQKIQFRIIDFEFIDSFLFFLLAENLNRLSN